MIKKMFKFFSFIVLIFILNFITMLTVLMTYAWTMNELENHLSKEANIADIDYN